MVVYMYVIIVLISLIVYTVLRERYSGVEYYNSLVNFANSICKYGITVYSELCNYSSLRDAGAPDQYISLYMNTFFHFVISSYLRFLFQLISLNPHVP